jgi:trans-2,3-dihydro-3-hydroxyanthranilate isomerase
MKPGIYKYQRIDVFTDRPFCGNPLAVFTDAQGLDTEGMQRIARELHLSETAFVFPTGNGERDYAVRVFAPNGEVKTGGAPTLGTVFALAREAKLRSAGRVVLQGQAGPVSVTMVSPMTTMRHPLPEFGEKYGDPDAAAAMLCLTRKDLLLPAPVQAVHCGIPYTLVPLRDLDALSRLQFRTDIWRRTVGKSSAPGVVAFTPDVNVPHTARSRVFAPGLGVAEDPATSTACGCIAAYLLRYGMVRATEEAHFIIAQGVEIGRPSEVHVTLKATDKTITSLRVGGECVWTGDGSIHIVPSSGPASSRPGGTVRRVE